MHVSRQLLGGACVFFLGAGRGTRFLALTAIFAAGGVATIVVSAIGYVIKMWRRRRSIFLTNHESCKDICGRVEAANEGILRVKDAGIFCQVEDFRIIL